MKYLLQALLFAITVSAFAPASHALTLVYTATLNGPNESPPNASPGIGTATVITDDVANTMSINVSFSGLTGNTTAAHIHSATAVAGTGTAGVATTTPSFAGFPLGVTSGSFSNTLNMTLASSYNAAFITANGGTTASAQAALFSGIQTGNAYFNIHTSTFGGGEIRGFLIPAVPFEFSPTAGLIMLSSGLVLKRYFKKRSKSSQKYVSPLAE